MTKAERPRMNHCDISDVAKSHLTHKRQNVCLSKCSADGALVGDFDFHLFFPQSRRFALDHNEAERFGNTKVKLFTR